MEALEFLQCYYKMCNSHVSDCVGCEAQGIDCELTTDEPEKLVAAVERWAKEHPEETAAATTHKNDEPCVKTIQDQFEGAIYREIISHKTKIEKLEHDVSVMRNNLAELHDKTYAVREKVYHTPAKEPSQTPEPKRTNKDVLLAAFPDTSMDDNGIPYACPNRLDAHYNCDKFENCLRCRHTHWLAEVEE